MAAPVSTHTIKRAEKELSQTKVILRHLPPDLTKEALLEHVERLHPLPTHTSFYFVPGSTNDGFYSRAYLDIPNQEDIRNLRDSLDGCQLESEKGEKYRLIVEYAPFQSSGLSRRPKPDVRCGTIEKDPDYLSFLEQYEKEIAPPPSVDLSYLDQVEVVPEMQPTPLIDYIREKRNARRSGGRVKVTYASSGRKKKEKVKVIEVKERSSKSSLSLSKDGQQKEKGGNDRKSTKPTVSGGNDKPLTNGDTPPLQGGGSGRKKIDESHKNKERPDQAFYSPRSRSSNDKTRSDRSMGGEKGESGTKSDRSGGARGGKSRNEAVRSDKSTRSGGGGGRGSGRGSGGAERGGAGKNWHRDDYYSSHGKYGGGKSSSSRSETYYHFYEEDDVSESPRHHSNGTRRDYSERDDRGRHYHGNRKTYDRDRRGDRGSHRN